MKPDVTPLGATTGEQMTTTPGSAKQPVSPATTLVITMTSPLCLLFHVVANVIIQHPVWRPTSDQRNDDTWLGGANTDAIGGSTCLSDTTGGAL